MDVYEAITKRRSIRQFKEMPIPFNILKRCVNAARLAPTGGNYQTCEHIIIDDEQLLTQVLDTVGSWGGQPRPAEGWSPEGRPKAYIVTLINKSLETELGARRTSTPYGVGTSIENMVLVALEQGIGACPILNFNRDKLRHVLNTPNKYDLAMVLALGFPDESPVLEAATDSIKLWVDSEGVRHVPKRELKDIIHRNRSP